MIEALIEHGCKNKVKKLQENSYQYCVTFIQNASVSYIAQTSASLTKLLNHLYTGLDSMPRIKKASTEAFTKLNTKLGGK